MEKTLASTNPSPTRVIAVTGGKGGTGKTTISVNLGVALAREKKKVLLFDADLGLSNIDVLLGLYPKNTVDDVLSGHCSLDDACVRGPHGLKIIPSSSGIQKMANLSSTESHSLIQSFSNLADNNEYMIVDLASGISCQVIDFTRASQDIIVVICNDPSSFSDSYAVIKILNQKFCRKSFGILVNKARNEEEGARTFIRFQDATSKFLYANMQYLGHIPLDPYVDLAAHQHKAIIDCFPEAKSVQAFRQLAKTVIRWRSEEALTGGVQFFFEKISNSQSSIIENAV